VSLKPGDLIRPKNKLADSAVRVRSPTADDKFVWGIPRWVEIRGLRFLLRPISRREYRELLNSTSNVFELEDELVKRYCLDFPRNVPGLSVSSDGTLDLDNCYAGFISSIAQAILDISGFGTSESVTAIVQKSLSWLGTEEGRFDALICAALRVSPEDIENLPGDVYLKYLSLAYMVASAFMGIPKEALEKFCHGETDQKSDVSAAKVAQRKETLRNLLMQPRFGEG
jgi:hypothetical protein